MSGEPLSVEAALATVLAGIEPLADLETVAPEDALGRPLATDLTAAISLPPWASSVMDGYAVRAADVQRATAGQPVRLTVVGEVRAGQDPDSRVLGSTAVRIATGARIPPGADAVVPVELTTPVDTAGSPGPRGRDAVGPLPSACLVHASVGEGNAIRPACSDVQAGNLLARAGDPVTPAVVALAAGVGLAGVSVRRRPVAAVLATGDEVRAPGSPLGPAGIPDAIGPGIRSLVREAGGVVLDLGIVGDRPADVEGRLRQGLARADVIVVSGGMSAGPDDAVRRAFDAIGDMHQWRVAIQPGKPFAFGRAEVEGRATPVLLFGLPGNAVSSFVTFELFVRPVLRRLAGHRRLHRLSDRAVLEEPVTKSLGRRGFEPVTPVRDGDGTPLRDGLGRVRVRPAGGKGSHGLSALAAADALAVIPEPLELAEAGTEVELRWLDRG